MSDFNFYPLIGMNNVAPDTDMVVQDKRQGRRVYARDLVNGRVDQAGVWETRPGAAKVSTENLTCLWYSERFNDTFAVSAGQLVKVGADWALTPLGAVGDEADYLELNNKVIVATPTGLFEYDGRVLQRLTIPDAPSGFPVQVAGGGLSAGDYAIAVSFRRGTKEGAVSETVMVAVNEGWGIDVTLPDAALFDPTITHLSVYASHTNGGDIYEVATVPVGTPGITLGADMVYGKLAAHRWMTTMPSGKSVRYWRGRLVTAHANVLCFSQPLNYHLTNPSYDFVTLPTRITFVEPVDGGLWVGQVDHVVFLTGTDVKDLTIDFRNLQAPVPWSSTLLKSELVEQSVDDSGNTTAVWLADNGYVLGTSAGIAREMSAGVLNGVSGGRGQTVAHNRFLLTITN